MKFPSLICAFLSIVFLANGTICFGFETDQYDRPPVPLADIGDEVSDYALNALFEVVANLNAEIAIRQTCVEKSNCDDPNEDRERLRYLRSDDAVADGLYKKLGDGTFPLTKVGNWINTHEFRGQPARYKTSYGESIFVLLPTNYVTISPTIRMYGAEFGVDKIEHLFQQGYTYYKINRDAAAEGKSPDEAAKKAVKWGRVSERTFYGSMVSGVFSNADLYANYAGMRFYQGLTKLLKIGGRTRPPVLALKNGSWFINETGDLHQTFLRPFISEHLNEASQSVDLLFLPAALDPAYRQKTRLPAMDERVPDAYKS